MLTQRRRGQDDVAVRDSVWQGPELPRSQTLDEEGPIFMNVCSAEGLERLRELVSAMRLQTVTKCIESQLLSRNVRESGSFQAGASGALQVEDLPPQHVAEVLVMYAELTCDLGRPADGLSALQSAVGIQNDDWTFTAGDQLAPNDSRRGRDSVLRGGNLPWLLRAVGAGDEAFQVFVRPDLLDPSAKLGFLARTFGAMLSSLMRSAFCSAADSAQAQRRPRVVLRQLNQDSRFHYQTALLRCLRDCGRYQDYGLAAAAIFWPHWGQDPGRLLQWISGLDLKAAAEGALLIEVTHWFERLVMADNSLQAGGKLADFAGVCGRGKIRSGSRLSRLLDTDRDRGYVLVGRLLNLLEYEGQLSIAKLIRSSIVIEGSRLLREQALTVRQGHRFAVLCAGERPQRPWHAELVSSLSKATGLLEPADPEFGYQRLLNSGCIAEWGEEWTSEVGLAVARMQRNAGSVADAGRIAEVFVRHFLKENYSEWQQAIGGRPEEFRLQDGRFEGAVRSATLVRWAMLYADTAVVAGRWEEAREAVTFWGGLETRGEVCALDRLLQRAVRGSFQPDLWFEWIQCALRAFCGSLAFPRLSKAQLLKFFAGPGICSLSGILENDFLKTVLTAQRRILFFANCLFVLDGQEPEFVPFCRDVIEAVRKLSFTELRTVEDRRQLSESMQYLRWVLVARGLKGPRESTLCDQCEIPPLLLMNLIEVVENRILLEQMLLRSVQAAEKCPQSRATAECLPEWAMVGSDWNLEKIRSEFTAWFRRIESGATDLHGMALSGCLGQICESSALVAATAVANFEEDVEESDCTEQTESFQRAAASVNSFSITVPPAAIWIRTLFGVDGQLYWWAVRRTPDVDLVEIIGSGQSVRAGARQRLELANLRLDAELEAVWLICCGQWNQDAWPLDSDAEQLLKTGWQGLSAISGGQKRAKTIEGIRETLGLLKKRRLPRTSDIGLRLLESINNRKTADEEQRMLSELWEGLLGILDGTVGNVAKFNLADPGFNPVEWKDRLLNQCCESHRKALQAELNLESLYHNHPALMADSHVILTLEGPLLAAPVAAVSVGEYPLFSLVRSLTTSISLSFDYAARSECGRNRHRTQDQRILSAMWIEPDQRSGVRGLPFLHAGLCELARRYHRQTERHEKDQVQDNWQVVALADGPPLTPQLLTRTLTSEAYQIVVVGGHGFPSKGGVALCEFDGSFLWEGDGNFFHTELIILCACAVGRLSQTASTDVAGLYTRMAANGGTSIVAARWLIDDLHAAWFVLLFLNHYLRLRTEVGSQTPFLRAEALNFARKECRERLQRGGAAAEWHLFTSFDVYGVS